MVAVRFTLVTSNGFSTNVLSGGLVSIEAAVCEATFVRAVLFFGVLAITNFSISIFNCLILISVFAISA